MELLTPAHGLILIGLYFLIMMGLTWRLAPRRGLGKEQFLVAGRSVGPWASAFSIAATWIWAPALFIAAQKAYTQGVAGLFWFTVPNVACLILFAYFARIIRRKMPRGYTLAGYMRERYSPRVQNLYLLQLVGLAVCSFAVQLLAGGKVVSVLTGLPFGTVTLLLAGTALSYSLLSGLRASVITDYAQMIFILAVLLLIVPWAVSNGGGWETVVAGLGGVSGRHGSVFDAEVFLTFGIAVTIGLISGPFGDQAFWQRAFATEESKVRTAFVRGALIFAVVPLGMSLLGFLAAGRGMSVTDAELVNLATVRELLPAWTVIPFVFMLLSGLISTLDSNLCAVASLSGHDLAGRRGEGGDDVRVIRFARAGMLLLALAALLIANAPGMKILYLFLFYGTLRASTLLPTILSLLTATVSERGVFWGIVLALSVGLPLFAIARLQGWDGLAIAGSVFTVSVSGLVAWVVSRWERAAPSAPVEQAVRS